MNDIERFVVELADIMWRGHHWEKTPDGPRMQKRALTQEDIERHAAGGRGVGLCPVAPGTSTTRVALLDLDSHKGEVPWPSMIEVGTMLAETARMRGLRAMPFRSSGGKGLHLLFTWQDAQDAASVRALLTEILAARGFKNGTKGVKQYEIEIFPKQDSVPADGYGSMFVLPFAGESIAFDPENGWREAARMRMLVSHPVPKVGRNLPTDDILGEKPEVPLDELTVALFKIDPRKLDYDEWRNVVFAWHSGGGDEATVQRWSEQNEEKHDALFLSAEVWPHIKDRPGGITTATIFAVARQQEQPADLMGDFTDVRGEMSEGSEDPLVPTSVSPRTLSLTWTDIQDIDADPPPPRDWIVPGWLAAGTVATFFAQGGYGKSLVAQQLLTSVAFGAPWLGLDTNRGVVMGIFAEEDDDELRRRQQRINASMGVTSAASEGRMFLQARLGFRNVLMAFDKRVGEQTRLFQAIEQEVERHRPRVLVLDNAAQLYAGEENDRNQVTQFLNALSGIARRHACAIVLVGHVAKAEGSQYSGTTAWENVGRVRLLLTREPDGSSTLAIAKSNISSLTSIALLWRDGIFEAFDRRTQNTSKTDEIALAVIDAIRRAVQVDEPVSQHHNVASYLPKVMLASGSPFEKRALADALDRLIALGVVKTEQDYGTTFPKGKRKYGLKVVEDHALIPKSLNGQDSDDIL